MVLVLDLMLPDMNGIALVQELERRGLRRMPILVMSASRRQLVQAQEANIGDAYILKGARGFSFHTVMDAIGKLSLQQAS